MTHSITRAVSTEMTVREGQMIIMVMRVATMVMMELMPWGMLWLSSWRRVSTSLVYTDMMSPWGWVSKYWMGRDSILENRSLRRWRMVPWLTLTMMRL